MEKNDEKISLQSQKMKVAMIDYLSFYSRIADINRDKELTRRYPQLITKLRNIIPKNNFITKLEEDLQTYDTSTIREKTFIYTTGTTKTIGFLRHLRNIIAHWNFQHHQNKKYIIILTDYKNVSKKTLTCYGKIDSESLYEILTSLTKNAK